MIELVPHQGTCPDSQTGPGFEYQGKSLNVSLHQSVRLGAPTCEYCSSGFLCLIVRPQIGKEPRGFVSLNEEPETVSKASGPGRQADDKPKLDISIAWH